jgi:peroxiredoxin
MKAANILGITKTRQYENTKSRNGLPFRAFALSCFRDFETFAIAIVLAFGLLFANRALATPTVGAPAPQFTAKDLDGKDVKLSDLKGKFVVLEWHNQGCPFVVKHYDSGNMQKVQKELTAQGVVWLTVISSAPGKQGYVTPEQEKKYLTDKSAAPTNVLLDPEGTLGTLYGAKTTPHMFIIDDKGVLVYAGAIDDKSGTSQSEVATARNYVLAAYGEAKDGKPVTTSSTAPYGCSVKYKD